MDPAEMETIWYRRGRIYPAEMETNCSTLAKIKIRRGRMNPAELKRKWGTFAKIKKTDLAELTSMRKLLVYFVPETFRKILAAALI